MPIYVNFNVNEQQVLQIREQLRKPGADAQGPGPDPGRGRTADGDRAFRTRACIDYVAPDLDQSTGTLAGQGRCSRTRSAVLLPGLFVRVRVPKQRDVEALLVPDRALGNSQQGRYVLIVNDKNVVEQRPVETGEVVDGGLRIIKSGLQPKERVVVSGIQRAMPGNVVKPVDVPPPARRGRPRTGSRGRAAARKDKQ